MLDPLGLAQSFEVTSCWRPAVHLLRTRWVHLKSICSWQMSFSKQNGHLAREPSPQSLPCQLWGAGTPPAGCCSVTPSRVPAGMCTRGTSWRRWHCPWAGIGALSQTSLYAEVVAVLALHQGISPSQETNYMPFIHPM